MKKYGLDNNKKDKYVILSDSCYSNSRSRSKIYADVQAVKELFKNNL